ncbi:hypothetical protein LTR37_017299 [Vermiconidia calcicola]|uniref:Uncharacterized protein n=1 Tax=Vermiconidia calcicola TaxID=1690605 RepID=A0ACC3MN60_9PEZI|nr:hypothetical protein LTR37_017299 [Vermiconidia calcicola]
MTGNAAARWLGQTSWQAFRCQYYAHIRIRQPSLVARRNLHSRPAAPPSLLRKPIASNYIAQQIRYESSEAAADHHSFTSRDSNAQQNGASQKEDIAARKAQEPAYELTFTCKQCTERSSHRVTHQAYHHGTTLITCPGCKNRHLISDHLKIFSDKGITIEDILREKGQFLRKGRLGEDGDIEFYDETNNETGEAQAQGKE